MSWGNKVFAVLLVFTISNTLLAEGTDDDNDSSVPRGGAGDVINGHGIKSCIDDLSFEELMSEIQSGCQGGKIGQGVKDPSSTIYVGHSGLFGPMRNESRFAILGAPGERKILLGCWSGLSQTGKMGSNAQTLSQKDPGVDYYGMLGRVWAVEKDGKICIEVTTDKTNAEVQCPAQLFRNGKLVRPISYKEFNDLFDTEKVQIGSNPGKDTLPKGTAPPPSSGGNGGAPSSGQPNGGAGPCNPTPKSNPQAGAGKTPGRGIGKGAVGAVGAGGAIGLAEMAGRNGGLGEFVQKGIEREDRRKAEELAYIQNKINNAPSICSMLYYMWVYGAEKSDQQGGYGRF